MEIFRVLKQNGEVGLEDWGVCAIMGCLPFKRKPRRSIKRYGRRRSIWNIRKYGLLVEVIYFYCSFWNIQIMLIHFTRYPSSLKTNSITSNLRRKFPTGRKEKCMKKSQFLRNDKIFSLRFLPKTSDYRKR